MNQNDATAIRSKAILAFCEKAGILPSVQVSGLPDNIATDIQIIDAARAAGDEIERLRDRLNLIATSPHADGWSKDRAKAALLDTPSRCVIIDDDQIRLAYELGLTDAALACRRVAKGYTQKLLREWFFGRRRAGRRECAKTAIRCARVIERIPQ